MSSALQEGVVKLGRILRFLWHRLRTDFRIESPSFTLRRLLGRVIEIQWTGS